MGQTCSSVQLETDRKTIGLQNSLYQKQPKNKNYVKEYLSKQRLKIKLITLIENSSELIYQFNDMRETVQKLRVENWQNSEVYEDFTIQDFINETTFVGKGKVVDQLNYTWKIISAVKVDSTSSQGLIEVGLFYYNLNKMQELNQISQSFIFAKNCWVQFKEAQKNKSSFIIESQSFDQDIVPLRQLGKFMKKNDICWQDKEFAQIIINCCRQVQIMHKHNFMVFEEFFITRSAKIQLIGGLIQEKAQFSQKVSGDYLALGVYLIETLYAKNFELNTINELQKFIYEQEQRCKFKHPQSLQLIINLLKHKQPTKSQHVQSQSQATNIPSYMQSYRIKTSIQPSIMLAQRYIELKQYFKAKEILFQRLSLLMYQQKDMVNQQSIKSEIFNRLLKKLNIAKSQFEECFNVLQHIIKLQRKIASQSNKSNQLETLIKEYVNLGILLSFDSRKQQNFLKSVSILQRVHDFLGQDNDSWLLYLHLAQCYFFAGRLDDAQNFYKTSIKFQINQANVSFFIKFYAAVLNWEKATSLLRTYEGLMIDDYLYDLLISKILLSKALCIPRQSEQNQEQRTQTFCECLLITRRIFDRKGIPELLLCEAYELIGDGNFYLKDNQKAFEAYEKGLALARSIDYSKKKGQNQNQQPKYQPIYIQTNQVEYSRSLSPHTVQNSIYKRSVYQKSSVNQTFMSIGSLVSQTQQKQSSFMYQLRFLHNFDKKAILLSSMANCRLMQRKYSQSIQLYQQARNSVLSHNLDLKNSIMGNMAICSIQMGKSDRNETNKSKLQQGKSLLKHIVNVTRKQAPSKLENDVNYLFLVNELQAQ